MGKGQKLYSKAKQIAKKGWEKGHKNFNEKDINSNFYFIIHNMDNLTKKTLKWVPLFDNTKIVKKIIFYNETK